MKQLAKGSESMADLDSIREIDAHRIDTEHLLERLSYVTRQMRLFGLLIFGAALTGVVMIFAQMAMREKSIHSFGAEDQVLMLKLLTIAICLLGFIIIMLFELLRRQGDVLFEELSNELQWGGNVASKGPVEKPRISERIILRSFVQASDLLLVPGRFGPAVYGLMFLALALTAFFISAPSK
jgi:hypothetical protein